MHSVFVTKQGQSYLRFPNLASSDDSQTWAKLLLITGQSAGYSDLAVIDAETAGILHEQSPIKFMKVSFSTLLGTPSPRSRHTDSASAFRHSRDRQKAVKRGNLRASSCQINRPAC